MNFYWCFIPTHFWDTNGIFRGDFRHGLDRSFRAPFILGGEKLLFLLFFFVEGIIIFT